MPFFVIQPPANEQEYANVGKEIYEASIRLGMTLDPEGFLFAWTAGTRVIVERDDSDVIVSLALVTIGRRWVRRDNTATVLELRGNRETLFEYVKQIAAALGASSLFIEEPEVDTSTPRQKRYTVTEHILQ